MSIPCHDNPKSTKPIITNIAQSMDKTISEIVLEHFESLTKQNAKK